MKGLIQSQLLETLGKIDRPGTFCTSELLPAILPGLEIAGVGSVGLPLEKRQATALKKQARQAPYGKGTQTLVDTNVRNVWEIDADQVVLANPQWADVLKQALASVQSALGLETQKLESHLYKLLLYEKGSFFLAHRDGEKLDRMVATLVVTLPSTHAGGELVVWHEGREEVVDFGPQSQFQTQFAAFYADCEHEIRPLTRGYRLSLIYNLTLKKARSKTVITAPTSREHIAKTAGHLRQWNSPGRNASDAEPEKLAVVVASFLRQPQVGLLVHRLRVVSSTGEPRQVIPFMTRFEQGWIAERVVRRGGRWRFLPTSGLCARRAGAAALFPLDEQLFRMWADSMLIYAGPLVTPIASLDRPLAQYRLHERNQSGTSQHTPRMVWHDLHSVHAPIKGANDRLEDLGRGRPFERRRNLQFVTQAFVLARLWGRPGSCRGYLGVMRAILKDDLYSWKQKLMGLVVYGVLVALPVSARGAWLDETLGMSRFKAWLQGLVSSRRPATTP